MADSESISVQDGTDSQPLRPARYHVLLVGIDDYQYDVSALGGCVNDVELIVNLLLQNSVALHDIEAGLFLAPREGRTVPWRFGAPTRKNILARLDEIARCAEPQDHVWIYYSGHGTQRQQLHVGVASTFEALVPVEFGEPSSDLIYDFEFGHWLARIKSSSVTVVLDCCNAAGATKSLPGSSAPADSAVRFIELSEARLGALPALQATFDDPRGFTDSLDTSDSLPTVVAACHADEQAREDSRTGRRQGILTATLCEALESCRRDQMQIQNIRWADIWQDVRQRVQQRNSAQQPWLSGPLDRPCLGGYAGDYDSGLSITALPTQFAIGAGEMLGLRPGSELGVYRADPPLFEEMNAVQDVASRIMTLQVVQASLFTSIAQPSQPLVPLPRGARVRLLSLCLTVFLDPDVAAQLGRDLLVEQARARKLDITFTNTPAEAELWIARLLTGDYALGDESNPPAVSSLGARPLAVLPAEQSTKETLREQLVTAMLHHAQYVLPLRMPRLAQASSTSHTLLAADALDVDLLPCEGLGPQDCRDLHENRRPRTVMKPERPGYYKLRASPFRTDGIFPSPDLFALWFRNHGQRSLFVTVLCCNSEGQVEEFLLNEQIPSGPAGKIVWRDGRPGDPFDMRIVSPRSHCIERLIIVAVPTKGGHGLESLKQARTLQQAMAREKSAANEESADRNLRRMRGTSKHPTAWTTRMLTIELALV